jgi:hypothetical protein
LVTRHRQLVEMIVAERNRRMSLRGDAQNDIDATIRFLQGRLKQLDERLKTLKCSTSLSGSTCLVPVFDGAYFSGAWKEALWDRFYTGAPPRQRRSVERLQHSQESLRALARRHSINPKTVAKWRRHDSIADRRTWPTVPRSTVLSVEQEAVISREELLAVVPSRT